MSKTLNIIGIIGFGNMGSAISEQLKAKYPIFAFDKDKIKTKGHSGINVCNSALDLFNKSDVVILAVKPQDFSNLLPEIKHSLDAKLIISIAAGISTGYIEKFFKNTRVIRIMPNLPARIGKGMICLCRGKSANKEDLNFSEQLAKNLGQTLILSEDMMDAACAVCGSGPGFLYDQIEGKNIEEARKYARDIFMPSLRAAAEGIGFTKKQAKILAEITTEGSISFLKASKVSASELKNQVTSKGGTTEAGLEVLQRGGSLEGAIKAALKRAKELSKAIF